jgi:hypothetical protein
MERLLVRLVSGIAPRRIVDLGGGDGTFLLRLARRLGPLWPDTEALLIDRHDLVTPETRGGFRALGWRVETVVSDVFEFVQHANPPGVDAVIANLFLHHFSCGELGRLFKHVAKLSPVFAACEPRRGRLAVAGSRALWMIGCNWVTRHDAVASVRAGFRSSELSELWPVNGGWLLQERPAGLFTHCFAARHVD